MQKIKWNAPMYKDNEMEIKAHVKGQLDVFFGEGFGQWARITILTDVNSNKKTIRQIAGTPLTKEQRKHILQYDEKGLK